MSMRALRQLTEYVDHQHNESMATLRDELGDTHLSENDPEQVATRRNFVRNLGIGGAAIAFGTMMVPVASLFDQAAAQIPAPTDKGSSVPSADLSLLAFAQGLEQTIQAVYTAIQATGKLQGAALQTSHKFQLHHNQHAALLASLLPSAQVPKATNAKVLALFSPKIADAADANALIQIAFNVETGAASTYQLALGTAADWQTSGAISTIEPIEAQHATVWGQAIGLPTDQWLPAFQNEAAALNPTTYAAG